MEIKLPKPLVHYQNKPHGEEQCDRCSMFREPNKCTLVQGHILPAGWCLKFDKK
jgi:hypothetical protein